MRKICCRKRERKQLQQKAARQETGSTASRRYQRTHDDLMKDMERLKNALGIDSSIIEQQYYNEINKVQKLCGNLSTQEGRWTITMIL
jgi:hypothetical protein